MWQAVLGFSGAAWRFNVTSFVEPGTALFTQHVLGAEIPCLRQGPGAQASRKHSTRGWKAERACTLAEAAPAEEG